MKTNGNGTKPKRLGMVIDVDRCTGCGACMVACAVENNVPPAAAERHRTHRPHLAPVMPRR